MKAYVEPGEVNQMEKAATNLRDKLLIHLLFHLGCRISEALALAVDDIDFDRSTITIQHLKSCLKLSCADCGQRIGRTHTFCPRCGIRISEAQAEQQERRRQRVLPVDSSTMHMLREYVQRGGPITKGGKTLLFGVNRHRGWQIVKRCAEQANLPRLTNPDTGKIHYVSPHKLRDAFAVRALKVNDSGDGLRLLQQHLGHASFNTTARYRKVSGDDHREWCERLWEQE
jgi:integrase/recombinase XerD